MKLTPKQIIHLALLMGRTRDHEMNCNECLQHVGEFVEFELAGKPIPLALEKVEHHLSICRECREEYQMLRDALRHLNPDDEFDIDEPSHGKRDSSAVKYGPRLLD